MIASIVSPGVVAVVMRVVPGVVADIGVVVVDDGGTTTTAPAAAPIHIPGVPAPAEASTPTATTERGANRDTTSKVETKGRNRQGRSQEDRHHNVCAVIHTL